VWLSLTLQSIMLTLYMHPVLSMSSACQQSQLQSCDQTVHRFWNDSSMGERSTPKLCKKLSR
jgi:hypothetical protein